MSSIYLKNGTLLVHQLHSQIPFILSEYEKEALEFCKKWLNGTDTFLLKTSGSTGKPKSILVTRSQIRSSISMTQKALNLQKGQTALVCLSIKYIAGQMMLARSLEIGMDVILQEPSSNPFSATFSIPDSIDFIALVPLQLETMLSDLKSREILNNVKNILIGGAPVSFELIQSLQRIKAPIYHTFGMTETVSHIALKQLNGKNPPEFYRVLDGVQIDQDQRGCLTIQSKVTNNKKIVTNDLIEMKGASHFKWLGRADNVINSGGLKINPEQLENIIQEIFYQLKIKRNFIICGISTPRLGEEISLIIEGSPLDEIQTNELLIHLKSRFTKFLQPRKIIYMPTFIFVNNKIDRKSIQQKFVI